MHDEFNALLQNQTWQLVPRPTNQPFIGCKWVYKTKPSVDDVFHQYKASLVAKVFHQEEGLITMKHSVMSLHSPLFGSSSHLPSANSGTSDIMHILLKFLSYLTNIHAYFM